METVRPIILFVDITLYFQIFMDAAISTFIITMETKHTLIIFAKRNFVFLLSNIPSLYIHLLIFT